MIRLALLHVITGLVINSSSFKLEDSPDDLRVVFTYSGLLQADPGAGGYRKVLPGRLVDPAKMVNILQNSLEMQAYLFDKVLKFVF